MAATEAEAQKMPKALAMSWAYGFDTKLVGGLHNLTIGKQRVFHG